MTISLSIITPTFNSINFIEDCINNVIQQKCTSLEHLIIDGGSTDGTTEIVKSYAKKYSHIKWLSEKDKGQSDAMNKGINLASGEILSFLNADDRYFAFVLNRILNIFDSNTNLNFISGNCKLFDTKGNLIYINRPKRLKPYHLFSFQEPFPINPVAYFYKKKIHSEIGYYTISNHFNMDYEFILKAVKKFNLTYFNEDWGYAFHHENAKTVMDKANNEMESRKLKTFNEIYTTLPLKLKILSQLYSIYKKTLFK